MVSFGTGVPDGLPASLLQVRSARLSRPKSVIKWRKRKAGRAEGSYGWEGGQVVKGERAPSIPYLTDTIPRRLVGRRISQCTHRDGPPGDSPR